MKKLLALMLAAALALSLVACGGGSGAGDTNTPSTPGTGNGDTTSTDGWLGKSLISAGSRSITKVRPALSRSSWVENRSL